MRFIYVSLVSDRENKQMQRKLKRLFMWYSVDQCKIYKYDELIMIVTLFMSAVFDDLLGREVASILIVIENILFFFAHYNMQIN